MYLPLFVRGLVPRLFTSCVDIELVFLLTIYLGITASYLGEDTVLYTVHILLTASYSGESHYTVGLL